MISRSMLFYVESEFVFYCKGMKIEVTGASADNNAQPSEKERIRIHR